MIIGNYGICYEVLLIQKEKLKISERHDLRTRRRFHELKLEYTASSRFYYYQNTNIIEQCAK